MCVANVLFKQLLETEIIRDNAFSNDYYSARLRLKFFHLPRIFNYSQLPTNKAHHHNRKKDSVAIKNVACWFNRGGSGAYLRE